MMASPPRSQVRQEPVQCAICFEAAGPGVNLPCRCQVSYCHLCWETALARSFNACAKVRCPTCRSVVRVDFDAQTGQLLFSEGDDNEDVDLVRRRISEQLRPVQVRLLREFGEAHPPPLPRQQGIFVDIFVAAEHAAQLSSNGLTPLCLCGGKLQRVTLAERARRFFVQAGQWRNSDRLAPVLAEGLVRIICDLCGEPLDLEQPAVWVCENGDTTIKHATSNDICLGCFVHHAWGVAATPALLAAHDGEVGLSLMDWSEQS
mmetsp:Transcript_102657/g.203796  ORF Transcript_102657/g.203796 Transcript_102657/m.203796 type:complete len:261 (-) Transcript_102657:11-793(-)